MTRYAARAKEREFDGTTKTRVSLIETARFRLSPMDATALLDLYNVTGAERASLLELVRADADRSTDALTWITSHSSEDRRHDPR